jgi:hypothetical protein
MQPLRKDLQSLWMIRRWGLYLAILALPAMGGTISDITAESTTVVHTGDTLIFQLLTSNFVTNAAGRNFSLYPAEVNFAFMSAPLTRAAFSATLESADGEVSMALGDLAFGAGFFQSSQYTGDVSVLKGHLSLSMADSASLFSALSIVITLQNKGPDVTVGLAPYLLRQDLFAGLSGGPLSVGAIPGLVMLESLDRPSNSKSLAGAGPLAGDSEVPEPRAGGLLLGGCLLLCVFSTFMARVARKRGQDATAREINRLHPLIHSDTI